MKHLRLYKLQTNYQKDVNDGSIPEPCVIYTRDTDVVHWKPYAIIEKTVEELINEGYAIVYDSPTEYSDFGLGGTSSKGIRIRILDTCPYKFKQIIDIQDVALNNKQIYSDENGNPIDNIIVWNHKESYYGMGTINESLPPIFSNAEVIGIYNNNVINFQPQSILLADVDFDGVKDFTLTFAKGNSWQASAQGIFKGSWFSPSFTPTPENIKVVFQENYSSVFQRMFQHCETTKRIELSGATLSMQADGMFEYCYQLEEVIFNCNWNWNNDDIIKATSNMFHDCYKLKIIPLKASLEPTEANRETQILSVTDGGCYEQMFCHCESLTTIMPVLDFANARMVDMKKSFGTFTDCNVLSDIRIKNLGNCDWDFVSVEGASLPLIDVASINYLLNNVRDVTADGGYEIRLPLLHQAEIDSAAFANATAKGWTVVFGDPVYTRTFEGWQVNSAALGEYEMNEHEISISKFKPNTWLLKYVPEVADGQTMNEAIRDFLYGFDVKITGIEAQTGDETKPISWYKTNNDGGGYWCRGILLSPFTSWNSCCVTSYPWEMSVPNGGFKNPNNGAHYYGYTKDGYLDIYTYNSTHTYPENSAAYAGLAIYTGSAVDADGYITLENPITIKLL